MNYPSLSRVWYLWDVLQWFVQYDCQYSGFKIYQHSSLCRTWYAHIFFHWSEKTARQCLPQWCQRIRGQNAREWYTYSEWTWAGIGPELSECPKWPWTGIGTGTMWRCSLFQIITVSLIVLSLRQRFGHLQATSAQSGDLTSWYIFQLVYFVSWLLECQYGSLLIHPSIYYQGQ